ncbi:MAG: hypothetical protein K6C14_02960 [Eubacterium sp.]|nr:hypothetical protein [Eubacterium sp.]
MKTKRKLQLAVDVLMTAILMLQMSYSLAGELLHEITGILFFALFVIHHIVTVNYTKALLKGKRTADKVIKLSVDIVLLVIVICMLLSAVPISKHLFTFLGINRFSSLGRTVHLLGAYWGFALINIHIGFHLDKMLNKPLKDKRKKPVVIAVMLLISGLGLYFFISEEVYKYMLLINRFVFLGASEGPALFLLKYIFIGGMFESLAYLLIRSIKSKNHRSQQKE